MKNIKSIGLINLEKKILAEIDKAIERKSILKHPFYQQWSAGRLSKKALREYAKQYYQLVFAFPTLLSAAHSNCNDLNTRKMLLENLGEEEGRVPHSELWLRFCDGLQLRRSSVINAEQLPETRQMVENLRDICKNSGFVEAIAAIYAYESQNVEVAKAKIYGLRSFYGMKDRRSLEFFDVHGRMDVKHSAKLRAIMKRYNLGREEEQEVLEKVNVSLDSLWGLLDGVHQRYC